MEFLTQILNFKIKSYSFFQQHQDTIPFDGWKRMWDSEGGKKIPLGVQLKIATQKHHYQKERQRKD